MTARILYVTHRVPYPPDRGDRIRTWNVLKFLAGRAALIWRVLPMNLHPITRCRNCVKSRINWR
jgi:hypothetical protein